MIPVRHVWLAPRELRRDFGAVDDLDPQENGASGRLRYDMASSWRKVAILMLAAVGAGFTIAAPLLAMGGNIGLAAAIGVGALYVAALRLTLTVRARDRTLAHHGRFLPSLSRIRVEQLRRRPAFAAMRLYNALAAQQGMDDARDLCAAIVLRAVAPIAIGLWLGSDALPAGAMLSSAALASGLVAGSLAERSRHAAIFHAVVVKAAFARRVRQVVAALPTLRDLGAADRAVERLRRTTPLAAEYRAALATVRMSMLFRLAVPALAIGVLLRAAAIPVVTMLGIAVATVAAAQAGAALGVQWSRIMQARRQRGVASRLFSAESAPGRTIDRIDAIEVRDLSFRYAGAAAPVFERAGFALRSGEVLALSSPSGSGKTTLLRVITALAEPCAGGVLVNGLDAHEVAYRHRVAAVFQDEPVGAGTIRAAIAGSAPIGLDAVWATAARVGADTLIRALPMAMQTLIVEGPFPPSLLQPLLIARALAQEPDLLILDEALGALPYERARELLESLRAEGKLVIFASHDPQMVALADKVLALGT